MDESSEMDPATARLINELLTRLGMLMEDASSQALLSDSCGGSLGKRVSILEVDIARMKSISKAAKALLSG
jgi:hypothetical protein